MNFRDQLLFVGVKGRYFVSSTEAGTIYRVEGFQKSRSTGDEWAVRRVSYSFEGKERTELGATKRLVDCMEDPGISSEEGSFPESLRSLAESTASV